MIVRDIYINSTQVTPPIRIVYGTDNLPVQFRMKDITLASGNTAKFYSLAPSENRYEQTGTIDTSAGTITFTPVAGFFEFGQNLLQCEIKQGTKFLYSFAVDVLCAQNLLEDGTAAKAEAIKTYVERAEDAADSAEASAQVAQEVLDSIPHDYSEMSDIVDDLVDTTEELDVKVLNAFPTSSASGAVASFSDGADGIPLKDMTVQIVPVQAGTGDPGPENVRAISGWDACNITVNSKNLINQNDVIDKHGINNDTGVFQDATSYALTGYIDVSGINSVTVRFNKLNSDGAYFKIARYNSSQEFIDFAYNLTTTSTGEKVYVVDTSSCAYIVVQTSRAYMLNPPNVFVAETWNRYTIQLGQTVYGGTLNPLTGVLTVNWAKKTYNGTESWADYPNGNGYKTNIVSDYLGGGISDIFPVSTSINNFGIRYNQENPSVNLRFCQVNTIEGVSDVDSWKAWLAEHPVTFVYPISTETKVQLTPVQIATLLGQNNIWADTGDISVTYRADPTMYIDGQVAPIKAMVASEETGTTASQAYTAGQYFILDGQFCKALTNIASGATFTLGTNYQVTTIGAELYSALNS